MTDPPAADQTLGFFILFEFWILEFGIYLQFGACTLLFTSYPDWERSLQSPMILKSTYWWSQMAKRIA
jgi:cbb3-type cytochrome oxidase subunit 1